MKTLVLSLAVLGASLCGQAHAVVGVYADKAAYMAATGSTQATAAYFDGGNFYSSGSFAGPYASYTSGSVTFTQVGASKMYFGDFTSRLPGGDMSVDSVEQLDLAFTAPVQAFGFDFVEPQFDPGINAPFVDSTFTVTLRQGSTTVGTFSFNAPKDLAAFVGASSTVPFNNVQIRETVGGAENEFYGQFYSAATLPVPEPASWALLVAGLAGGVVAMRRQRAG